LGRHGAPGCTSECERKRHGYGDFQRKIGFHNESSWTVGRAILQRVGLSKRFSHQLWH
jgi:hypothetical protein